MTDTIPRLAPDIPEQPFCRPWQHGLIDTELQLLDEPGPWQQAAGLTTDWRQTMIDTTPQRHNAMGLVTTPKPVSTTCSKCGAQRDPTLKKITSLCRAHYNERVAIANAKRRRNYEYRGSGSKKWLVMQWVRHVFCKCGGWFTASNSCNRCGTGFVADCDDQLPARYGASGS